LTSNRFYIQENQLKKTQAVLTGDEHHHLSRVVRKKKGDQVYLFTKNGQNFTARIDKIERSKTFLTLLKKDQKKEPDKKIILAPSLVKSKSFEFILQKSTELGITSLAPLITERSIINVSNKTDKKIQRWNRIVLEASKQCQRPFPPQIEEPLPLSRFLDIKKADLKIFLNEEGGEYLKDLMIISTKREQMPSYRSIIILLGPEGGWTEDEKQDIVHHGYKVVSLGKNILRAETAAIACVSIISHLWNS